MEKLKFIFTRGLPGGKLHGRIEGYDIEAEGRNTSTVLFSLENQYNAMFEGQERKYRLFYDIVWEDIKPEDAKDFHELEDRLRSRVEDITPERKPWYKRIFGIWPFC